MTSQFDRVFAQLPHWKQVRHLALSHILRIPLESVDAWERDVPRRAAVNAEWEDVKATRVPASDINGRQAVARCQQYGLSAATVRAARDHELLALYGFGPRHLAYLRALLAAPAGTGAPPRPLPNWVHEE